MAADAYRLVDVRAALPADESGVVYEEQGSGLLVTDDLILTAAHVVFDGNRRLPVSLHFPASGVSAKGRVVWPHRRGQTDAALVRVTGRTRPPSPGRPMRWGRFTGREASQSVDATGFPRVMVDAGRRVSYQLSGHVNPQGGLHENRYLLAVDDPPADPGPGRPSPWAGMSGAGAMSGGVVIGVVVIDTPGFDRDLLTVVPAADVLDDQTARELLGVSGPLVSVELDPVLSRPAVSAGRLSPAQLLRADEEVIPFQGREAELGDLTAWCTAPEEFGAWLVAGPGGRGKTRLAQALVEGMEQADGRWVCGLLSSSVPVSASLELVMATSREHPVLLVADYAESRGEQVDQLLEDYERADSPPRLRLLLLARDRGEWWDRLVDRHIGLLGSAPFLSLTALHPVWDRDAAFASCVQHFASRLASINPAVDWPALASTITAPDLREERFGDPLALQLQALLALLEAGGTSTEGEAPELRLIAHERQYWRRTLEAKRLNLSDTLRDQAVAAATLIAARDWRGALTLLQRVPALTEHPRVAEWLHSLYPTDASKYWGSLQPDRLGEHHVGAVTRADPSLLQHLLGSEDAAELQEALVIIGRAMSHQPHLQEQVEELLRLGPPVLSAAAAKAADRVANPLPLLRAMPSAAGHRYTIDPDDYGSASSWGHSSSVPEKLSEISRGVGDNPYTSSYPPGGDQDREVGEAVRDLPPAAPPVLPAPQPPPAAPEPAPAVEEAASRPPTGFPPVPSARPRRRWILRLVLVGGVLAIAGFLTITLHTAGAPPCPDCPQVAPPPNLRPLALWALAGLAVTAVVAYAARRRRRARAPSSRPSLPHGAPTGAPPTSAPPTGVPPTPPPIEPPGGPPSRGPVSPPVEPPGQSVGGLVSRGREHERMATEAYEDGNLVMAAQQFGAAVSTFRDPSVPTEHLTRALLGHAAVLNDQRRFAQASATIDEAVSILSSEVAEGRIARDVMGRARDLQGGILAEMGELERAMSCGYDAVRILGEVDSGPDASPQTRRDHGKALSNLAGLTQRVGRISEAVRLSRRAVEIFEELRLTGTLQPDDATYARVILGDARIVATASGPEPALAELNRALEELHRIAGLSVCSKRTMAPDLAAALSFHSVLHRQLGDPEAALDSGQRAVETYLALADLRPAFLPDLATSLVNVANLHLDLGQAAIAVPDAQRAVHVLTKLVAEAEDTSQPVPATLTRFLARAQETLARARTSAWGG